jgi:hypothetical protein
MTATGSPIPVQVRGSHVDDRDIGLFAWREGADLVVKVPDSGSVDGGQAQHVPLMQVHGRDLLSELARVGVHEADITPAVQFRFRWHRDAKIFTIFEGTSEIQRMLIGRAVTGLDVR